MAKSIGGSMGMGGHAASEAKYNKTSKSKFTAGSLLLYEANATVQYQRIVDRRLFLPLVFETFGSWGQKTKTHIADIAKRPEQQMEEALFLVFEIANEY
ncbi:hypothetical protein BV898_14125 [Hypsibius exemplaris]|uniref:Uncharacterized protein n=1 Tax=Hypsibius exemplaris TaxID=2072580 RepID=A0A1W0W8Q7_HYPEX|nr:hypothetical protein BV898_14125 [Hypsibius exemplaris]